MLFGASFPDGLHPLYADQKIQKSLALLGKLHLVINMSHPMDLYDENHQQYISDPAFPAVEAKVKAKGFRKATASAQRTPWAPDLFCAFGGLWVKAIAAA